MTFSTSNDVLMLPPPRRKTCIRSSEDPDVRIVVGGVEYQEYSQALRCWSEYFDRALSSGMRESSSKRFEFPHRDPKEWELIVDMMKPMSKKRVSKANLSVVASWFGELGCVSGLKVCDDLLCGRLRGYGYRKVITWFRKKGYVRVQRQLKQDKDIVLDVLELSLEYNLTKSLEMSFGIVNHTLKVVAPTNVDLDWFRRLGDCVQYHPLLEEELWCSARLKKGKKSFQGVTSLSEILFLKNETRKTKKRPLKEVDKQHQRTRKVNHYLFSASHLDSEGLFPVMPRGLIQNPKRYDALNDDDDYDVIMVRR